MRQRLFDTAWVSEVKWSRSVMSNSLQPHGLQSARLLWPWNSLGKNTGVGCHFLLQGIFPTQEPNLGLLHYRQILHRLSHQRKTFSNFLERCVGDTFFEILHVCKYFLILLLFVTHLFRIQSWNSFEGFLSYVLLFKNLMPSLSFVCDCFFPLEILGSCLTLNDLKCYCDKPRVELLKFIC